MQDETTDAPTESLDGERGDLDGGPDDETGDVNEYADAVLGALRDVEADRIRAHREVREAQEHRNQIAVRFDNELGQLKTAKQHLEAARAAAERYEDRLPQQEVDEIRRQVRDELADIDEVDAADLDLGHLEDSISELEDSLQGKQQTMRERLQGAQTRIQEAKEAASGVDKEWEIQARIARHAGVDVDAYWTPDDPLPEPEPDTDEDDGGGEEQ